MKKLFLVCLMMLAGSAWAEWVKYEETDTVAYYFDPTTIRKDRNMRRVWKIHDLKKQGGIGELSRRMRDEYDCKQERYRTLGASGHSEPMAGGKVLIITGEDKDWSEIPPDTINDTLLKIVCVK